MTSVSCWEFAVTTEDAVDAVGESTEGFLGADIDMVCSVERGKIAGGLGGSCGDGDSGAALVVCCEIAYRGGSVNSSTVSEGPPPIPFPPAGPLKY